ncbi:hypothetical protein, partial [Dietzia sp.]|uniref:hypothetical protein n=1 Tax=Dietzia sp. TaxID=1871616 RepID=UPI002FDB3312
MSSLMSLRMETPEKSPHQRRARGGAARRVSAFAALGAALALSACSAAEVGSPFVSIPPGTPPP